MDKRELWFILIANPDGYDFTFDPENRLWRKNLHDNNGDGQITAVDGVDPNRNFPTRWNYDNEGSNTEHLVRDLPRHGAGLGAGDQGVPVADEQGPLRLQQERPHRGQLLLWPFGWQVDTHRRRRAADDGARR